MSQATTTVANGTGKAVRTGFNAAIQAVQSMFYGSDDPLTLGYSVAEMIWIDSGNYLVKQMNSSNTAWTTIGTIDKSTGIITWTSHDALTLGGGTMTGALHQPNPVSITSSSGVVTLTEGSNSFVVSGTEAVTSITGWTAGIVVIRWATARTLTYNSTSLILQNSQNRTTAAGDIGIYEMTSSGAREINYFLASTSSDMSAFPLGQGDYIASGMKMSSITSLVATLASGTVVIDNTPVAVGSGSVTLPVRKPNLIYSLADGSIGYVSAISPTTLIDNYTVGMWIFNETTAGANIPNSAYGVSSSAVANDLTASGGLSSVDGWVDYAIKADGSSGYYSSANMTNFPTGASIREIDILFTYNKAPSATAALISYGAASTSQIFGLYFDTSSNLCFWGWSNDIDTGFDLEIGKTYNAVLQYDGTKVWLYINGSLVWSYTTTLSTVATYGLNIFRQSTGYTGYTYATVHYVEIRTSLRTAAQIGAISNKFCLPCFYTKNSATAPTVPSAYSSSYHEYLFSESSGTSVADSNTTSALTGTATNTTAAVTSDIGLTYARKFSAGYVSLGSLAVASTFSYIGVINISSYSSAQCLWSNRPSGGTGVCLYINTSGYLCYISGTTTTVLSSTPINLGTPVFIAVTVNGTSLKWYIGTKGPVSAVVTTPSTTSAAAYLGYDVYGSYTFTGKMEYAMFVNSELSQAEINYYYTELMATGRRSIIDDMLPSSSVALAFARTNSSKIIEYNDDDYKYGRREKATGGNRKVFLGWKYFSGSTIFSWDNPFGTGKVIRQFHWAQDANGTNELPCVGRFYNGSSYYGVEPFTESSGYNDAQNITARTLGGWVVVLNGVGYTTGYIGCYAEVLEDSEGV